LVNVGVIRVLSPGTKTNGVASSVKTRPKAKLRREKYSNSERMTMFKPLRDKIIVRPEQRIKSDLWVKTAEADTVGYITAVGEEAAAEGLLVGDKVYFGTLAKDYQNEYLKFDTITIDDQRHLRMSWQDICFVEEI
jgi:co-chaperonin GroES (HSP10)